MVARLRCVRVIAQVMAIWNAPLTQADHVFRALQQVGGRVRACVCARVCVCGCVVIVCASTVGGRTPGLLACCPAELFSLCFALVCRSPPFRTP